MNKLINTESNCITMDSREIAELTEKQHAHICRDIRSQLDFQGIDQSKYGSVYLDSYNREQTCYKLDYEQTMILLTGYSVLLRAKVIKRWTELESKIKPKLPQSYSEALRELATTVEENERLKIESEENKPKVEFFNAVVGSDNTIDMGSVAKVLNINKWGRNRIFQFLRDNKILQCNNQPYQQYVDRGYFRMVESKYTKPDGSTHINLKTVVYQKGLDYIRKKIKGVN